MEVEIALEAPKRKWKVRNCQENPSGAWAPHFRHLSLKVVGLLQFVSDSVVANKYIQIHEFTDFEFVVLKQFKKKKVQ